MAHVNNGGGLQQHSIGESYPFAVVGTVDELTHETRYFVMNLIDGHRRYRRDGQPYYTSIAAHAVAESLANKWRKHASTS